MEALATEQDLMVLTAFRLCTKDDPVAAKVPVAKHYETCQWCKNYVAQKSQSKQYSVSEVGWWSGYADRERS